MDTLNNNKLAINNIWFFDLDDTLVSTTDVHKKACSGVSEALSKYLDSEVAKEVEDLFCHYFQLIFDAYHVRAEDGWKNLCGSKEEYEELLLRIEKAQKNVIREYGYIKRWSREVLIKLAMEVVFKKNDLSIDIIKENPNLIYEPAIAYWNITLEQMHVFDDAKTLLEEIHSRNEPIFITTSSDGRLLLDDDGEFYYDPFYSEKLKHERIEKMQDRGLLFNEIIIGDPEDKPSREYFQKALNIAESYVEHRINTQNCIMVGDSYEGDLKIPLKKLNFGLCVLINRENPNSHFIEKNYFECHDLREIITRFIE